MSSLLEALSRPVVTQFDFFHLIWCTYQQATETPLYLRQKYPTEHEFSRLRRQLTKAGIIQSDPDYGTRIIRITAVSDLPAENIACMADPTCYVSHLSAMQHWGLTNRIPERLHLTLPDRTTAHEILEKHASKIMLDGEQNPFATRRTSHPPKVRRRKISQFSTKSYGANIVDRSNGIRLSTIGQTFLDMLQKPSLCGGMSHVLDVWTEHGATYLDEIVETTESSANDIIKVRAGYILEERLGLQHPGTNAWLSLAQRGGSRKLDPDKNFAPEYSERWMLSLNA